MERKIMEFTIKELCKVLETEVPAQLRENQDKSIKAINARYTTLEDGDVFFDINNDCEDLSLINPKRCPFIISDREIKEGTLEIPVVRIDNALDRYVNLCKLYVDEYPDTVRIAVTGSTGKTSMKETIASILGNTAATDKTFSNQNNIYFLSKRLKNVMPDNLRFYVQEACIKVYEDINLTQKLAEAFKPKIVVMTNIFDNHAEIYGDRETTFQIKSSLVEEMDETGIALLNMDDDILRNYKPNCKTIYYSLNNSEADIYADNIEVSNTGTTFDIHWQGRIIKDVFCPLIGRPNIYNCMVAFAIGSLNGVDDELLVRSIRKINLSYSLRQNHIKVGPYNLFIDCFNASLESIENDMKTMVDLSPDEGGRKIVVLGDIAELGEKAENIHREIGKTIVKYKMDQYFYLGEYADCIYNGATETNPEAPISVFTDRDELERRIKDYIKPGDLILWKASRNSHIELSIDNLFGTDYYPLYPNDYDKEAMVHIYPKNAKITGNFIQRYYRMGEPIGGLLGISASGGNFEYCIYENGIKFVRYNSIGVNVDIPQYIDGISMRSIGDRAFYKSKIISVNIPESVLNISTNAFLRSYNLRIVRLPQSIKFINYSAFAYCTALEEISIPEGCLLIRSKAFYQCKRLRKIIIEGMDTYLEENAFQDCSEIEINCKSGSFAEKYAINHGIKYKVLQEDDTYGELIVPCAVDKEIVIDDLYWEEHDDKSRLNISISIDDEAADILWYEVDKKWKKYVNDDRIDAVVVSLLLFAIRGKFTRIRSKFPISEKLKYQLTYHLIPQIVEFEGKENATEVILDMPTTNKVYEKTIIANGTGFSRGVDSFATLYEYGKNSAVNDDYKVNFLNVYNVGAFHGLDSGKRSYHLSRELYKEQMEDTVRFADEYGYNVLVVDSNLAMFIRSHFNSVDYGLLRKFQNSATERNIGTTLLFQKLFSRFYYASGHTLKEFKLSLDESSALWEQYAVQFFSTENINFYISNRNWTRMEKVRHIAELPEAYDNLQVCLVSSKNCGTCMKCKRTLMNLDVLGEDVLDRFKNSFDIVQYKKENREKYFESLWEEKDEDAYAKDILQAAIDNKSDLVNNLPIDDNETRYTYKYKTSRLSVLSLPTYMSDEICLLLNDVTDKDLVIKGIYKRNWVKVQLPDKREGYINIKNLELFEFRPAVQMNLNAGSFLRLKVGRSYGVAPLFVPKNGNEQVNYSIEDNNIAFVNKMGRVYAVSEGSTVLTAKSESGLTAKCIINVEPYMPNMRLNAGNDLLLYVGKKYGILPMFEPKEMQERVTYSIDNDNIAIVNKNGWVYAISEGTAILTAKSKSGAVAKVSIRVKKPDKAPAPKSKFKKIVKYMLK